MALGLPYLCREILAYRWSAIFLSIFFGTDLGLDGLRSVFVGDVLPEADLGATLVGDYLGADLALEAF